MFIDIVDKIYLTIVDADLVGDTFFPQIDYSKWNIDLDSINDNNEYVFQNLILTKKV
jgi:dihydrofolate reductase